MFDQYIDAARGKTIYLDVIIESEYDPMAAQEHCHQLDTRPKSMWVPNGFQDPMVEQIDKVMEIHNGGRHLPQMQKCPGRQGLSLREWASGQIESTPHGFAAMFFTKSLMEKNLTFDQKEAKNPKNKSKLLREGVMDHYNVAYGSAAVLAELPKGKRAGYTGGPSKRNINVLNPMDATLPKIKPSLHPQ